MRQRATARLVGKGGMEVADESPAFFHGHRNEGHSNRSTALPTGLLWKIIVASKAMEDELRSIPAGWRLDFPGRLRYK